MQTKVQLLKLMVVTIATMFHIVQSTKCFYQLTTGKLCEL